VPPASPKLIHAKGQKIASYDGLFGLFDPDPDNFQGCGMDLSQNADLGVSSSFDSLDTMESFYSMTCPESSIPLFDFGSTFEGSLNPGLFGFDADIFSSIGQTAEPSLTVPKVCPSTEDQSISNIISVPYPSGGSNIQDKLGSSSDLLPNLGVPTANPSPADESTAETIRRLQEQLMQKELLIQRLQSKPTNPLSSEVEF